MSITGVMTGVIFCGVFIIFGVGGLYMAVSLVREIFGPVRIQYDPKQIEETKKAMGFDAGSGSSDFNDLRGAGGKNDDEAEWRYRASGGYGGEFFDDLEAGTGLDLEYRGMGTGQKRG